LFSDLKINILINNLIKSILKKMAFFFKKKIKLKANNNAAQSNFSQKLKEASW